MWEEPLVIENREELAFLLAEGAELEHGIMCQYLFAAFSLKQGVDEGLTPQQFAVVEGWRRELLGIAGQEMLHFALVTNLLTALGYSPHVGRPNFPAPIRHYPSAIQLAMLPFGEDALEHFMFLERPEGMELPDAPEFKTRVDPIVPLDGRAIMPGRQAFATVGHLYRSIEAGVVHLVDKFGEREVFVGPPRAQAVPEAFHWPDLVPVTDVASAKRAMETIVEQGEGMSGEWVDAHYGRFVAMCDAYREMKTADPTFQPARPCVPTFVREPMDTEVDYLVSDPTTSAVADVFNVAYEVTLRVIARYFAHGHETPEQLQVLADSALALMRGVIRPVGQLLTRLPAGPDNPGLTAGPAFEVSYTGDYLLPHHQAAWRVMAERLRGLALYIDSLLGDPALAADLVPVRDAVGRLAARLEAHRDGGPRGPVPASEPVPASGPVTEEPVESAPGPAPAPAGTVSFARDIRPLFREQDRQSMDWSFDLWSHDDVRAAADRILVRMRDGSMPCDGPWPTERVDLFARWIDAGMPA